MNDPIFVFFLSLGIIFATCAQTKFIPNPSMESRNVQTTHSHTISSASVLSTTIANSTTETANKSGWESISDGKVHDLGLENWNRVLESFSFVLVLFHDGSDNNDESTKKQQRILAELSDEYTLTSRVQSAVWKNVRVGFGRVNTRIHSDLRDLYAPVGSRMGLGKEYHQWYISKNKDSENEMLNSESFMAMNSDELPKFSSYFMLFRSFDVLEYMEEDMEMEISGTLVTANMESFSFVKLWLRQCLQKHVHLAMNDVVVGAANHPYQLVEIMSPEASIPSRHRSQKEQRETYLSSRAMETIDWEAVDRLSQKQRNRNVGNMDLSSIDRQLRESTTGISVPVEGEQPFYNFTMTTWNDFDFESDMLHCISDLFRTYLTFADSYENLWDDERKAREDLRTGYGHFLQTLNDQVRDLLLSTFEDMRNGDTLFFTPADIPELESYYRDLVFGYGRSPSSLEDYMKKELYNLTKDDDLSSIELFERIREYMRVTEAVNWSEEGESHFEMFHKTLFIQLYNFLAEFHTNISRHFQEFERKHGDQNKENRFPFTVPDNIDMRDPQNLRLLSDYDEFERRYTMQRKPVVLSNVAMTTSNWTVEYLVEKCGFMDVTKSVKRSYSVHEEGVDEWGGLTDFVLPKGLMGEQRLSWLDDEDESQQNQAYAISLEQFVALYERFDNLYLHDFTIRRACTALFFDKSPYDPAPNQHFRIPSVIGQYDLFQKLPHYPYMYSWPSLFIGRKGSNSKLHVDSGATGFWMYLVSGRKRWVVYDEAERPFLYEALHGSSFAANVLMLHSTPNVTRNEKINDFFDIKFPLLNRPHSESKGYEFVQEAGQLIFIPPNSPHAVENLDDIVGIAFNLVPRAGVAKHLHHWIHSTNNFASLEIAFRYLITEKTHRWTPIETVDPLYATLGEYISQR